MLALTPYLSSESSTEEATSTSIVEPALIFEAAQELRYNRDWLNRIAVALESDQEVIPLGQARTIAFLRLMAQSYGDVTKNSYGEERRIYGLALRLEDMLQKLGEFREISEAQAYYEMAGHSLHDVIFLNNFLAWYLTPLIEASLDDWSVFALETLPIQESYFTIPGVTKIEMKQFVYNGENILDYGLLLGLLD